MNANGRSMTWRVLRESRDARTAWRRLAGRCTYLWPGQGCVNRLASVGWLLYNSVCPGDVVEDALVGASLLVQFACVYIYNGFSR